MKKELEESLRHIQAHPSTGLAHNQQQISTQVETIFAIDELKEQIIKLNKTIEESEKQNQRLEQSNYKLQIAMLILTAIGTIVIVYPILINGGQLIISLLASLFKTKLSINTSILTGIATILSVLSGVLSFFVGNKITKEQEKNLRKNVDEWLNMREKLIRETNDLTKK